MKSWLFDDQHRLRDGWKSLAFFVVAILVVGPILLALHALPVQARAYVPKVAVLALGVLAATWVCVRAEGNSLASVGLELDARFAGQLSVGLAGGISALLLVAGLVWLCGGFHLEESRDRALWNLFKGAAFALGLAVMEELIYRGYAFQRAIRGMGAGWAQVVFAVLFCASHPLDQGMSLPSTVLAMLNLFLLALVVGFCYLRTHSLAVPIGAHAAWNWAQQSLGFGVSGIDSQGWWSPVFRDKPDWLTGGAFGLEASAVGVVVLASVATLLALWDPPSAAIRRLRTSISSG
jgi:uncharacterized protein